MHTTPITPTQSVPTPEQIDQTLEAAHTEYSRAEAVTTPPPPAQFDPDHHQLQLPIINLERRRGGRSWVLLDGEGRELGEIRSHHQLLATAIAREVETRSHERNNLAARIGQGAKS